jgi:uncharacterized membrane protein
MQDRKELAFRIGMLVAIALTATVVAFALEDYFGSSAVFIALGHGLAVFGAIVFALKRLTTARAAVSLPIRRRAPNSASRSLGPELRTTN